MQLNDHEIHIWCYSSKGQLSPELKHQYRSIISPQELTKVERYRFAKDQQQSLVSRAMIRHACSHYLQAPKLQKSDTHKSKTRKLEPQHWSFSSGKKGKPYLSKEHDSISERSFQFNLSHSNDMILLALGKQFKLGVDVEHIKRQNDILSIANRYFSTQELIDLNNLESDSQENHFFDYWTLKESYIKACGQGLAIPLDSFSFNIKRNTQHTKTVNSDISLDFHKGRKDNASHWQSFLFDLDSDYRGALSIETLNKTQEPFKLRFFQCKPLHSLEEFELPFSSSGKAK